jgi:hypothetical protein
VAGIPRRPHDGEPEAAEPADINSPAYLALKWPAASGVGLVEGIAKAYGWFATGGCNQLGITQDIVGALTTPCRQ